MKTFSHSIPKIILIVLAFSFPAANAQNAPDPFAAPGGKAVDDPFADAARGVAKLSKKKLSDSFDQDEAKKEKTAEHLGVALTVEYIAVEHRDLSKLIREFGGDADSTALREKVGKMLEAKEAELIEIVYSRTGADASNILTESIEEVIYPTEFDPAEIPNKLQLNNVDLKEFRGTPATPAAFETRNVGTTVEFEALPSEDGKSIELALSPEIVEYLRKQWLFHPDHPMPEITTMWFPVFYTMKVTTTLTVKSGQDVLLATFTPSDRKTTKRVMLFIRAQTLTEKVEKTGKAKKP